ncbi:MAG: hypothetical protein U5K69_01965 [Balneolaceae bacterium]|nr:hypothetical protein [Balneolaceae bacterium]
MTLIESTDTPGSSTPHAVVYSATSKKIKTLNRIVYLRFDKLVYGSLTIPGDGWDV